MRRTPQAYGWWPYKNRPRIEWPGGARIAFWVAPNVEFYELEPPAHPARKAWPRPFPDNVAYGVRDYGNRVGHWRLMELMDRYNIRGSVSLTTGLIAHHPEIIEACAERDWEFYSHGVYNTRYVYGMTPQQEREMIQESMDNVERATGQRIAGYLSPGLTYTENTFDILADLGFKYTCDLFHDDQVTPVTTPTGKLCSVPYSLEYNDSIAFQLQNLPPRRYVDMLKAGFDRLYQEGAESGTVMCIPLHAYLVSHPYRMEAFSEIFEYITGHSDVWITTGREIAEYWIDTYWDAANASISKANS